LEVLGDSKLSKKFQITVPKPVREILDLETGNLLVFVVEGKRVVLKRGEVQIDDLQPSKDKVMEAYSK
jgi:AbrB family looped-hinge helix DNA binding protein